MARRKASGKEAVLGQAIARLEGPASKIPPRPEGMTALERILALVLQTEASYSLGAKAVKALKEAFVHWTELRIARVFEIRAVLSGVQIGNAQERAQLAQEYMRRVFGLQNHLDIDWLSDATSERRGVFLDALQMAPPQVAPVLDLDAQEETTEPLNSVPIRRVLIRLGSLPTNPKAVQVLAALEPHVRGKGRYSSQVALYIHGASVCLPKHPHCRDCELLDLCPYGKKQLGPSTVRSTLAARKKAQGGGKKAASAR